MMSYMWHRIDWMLLFIACNNALSTSTKGDGLLIEILPTCHNYQFMPMEDEVPVLEAKADTVTDQHIATHFDVGMIENNMIGNITWTLDEDDAGTSLVVALSLIVKEQIVDKQYILIQADRGENLYNRRRLARLNCLQIPSSSSTSFKAEVFQINKMSCDCRLTGGPTREILDCIQQCHMYHISESHFPASRDACYFYRERHQDEVTLALRAEMISTDVTRFRGDFKNLNPYSTVHVWVFSDDADRHVVVLSPTITVNDMREIYFSRLAENDGHTKFYAKLMVSCTVDDTLYDYYSNTAELSVPPTTVMPAASKSGQPEPQLRSEYMLGIVGIILLSGVITIATFIWCRCRNRTRCAAPESRGNNYSQQNITSYDHGDTTDKELFELSPEQTPFTTEMPDVDSEKLDNIECETSFQDSKHNVMLLYHPARANPRHIQKVAELCQTLDKHGIKLERRKAGNWRDFAESAFDKFPEVVLVMSEGLYTMCQNDKYGTPVPQHILAERNQETIPCVVLGKMCTLVHDHPDNPHIALHIVSLDSEDGQDEMLIKNFLEDHDFLRRNENYHVYNFCGNNLNSDENREVLNQFVTRLKPKISNRNFQEMCMEINTS